MFNNSDRPWFSLFVGKFDFTPLTMLGCCWLKAQYLDFVDLKLDPIGTSVSRENIVPCSFGLISLFICRAKNFFLTYRRKNLLVFRDQIYHVFNELATLKRNGCSSIWICGRRGPPITGTFQVQVTCPTYPSKGRDNPPIHVPTIQWNQKKFAS